MNCTQIQEHVPMYITGELPVSDRGPFEEHLAQCEPCHAEVSRLQKAWVVAAALPEEAPPRTVVKTLYRRIETMAVPSRWERGLTWFFKIGTAAAMLAVAFLTFMPPPTTRRQNPMHVNLVPSIEPENVLAYVRPGIGMISARDLEGRPVGDLTLEAHHVDVEINDAVSMTTIDETFLNQTGSRLEGTFFFPLPPGASISRLAMYIDGKLQEGEMVEREQARATYESIVRQMKDPALLEWMPGGIFKMRVFPIEPRSEKRIIIGYTMPLNYFDGRYQYVYPLASEKTSTTPPGSIRVQVTAKLSQEIGEVECPKLPVKVTRRDARTVTAAYEERNVRPVKDFVLNIQPKAAVPTFTALAHKPKDEDGYFMLNYVPSARAQEKAREARDYLFVHEVSSSMSEGEIAVGRLVTERLLETLKEGDRFEMACHNTHVTRLFERFRPVGTENLKEAKRFLTTLSVRTVGACDVLASFERLIKDIDPARPTTIVYVGEGVPTYGETGADTIVRGLEKAVGTKPVTIMGVGVGRQSDAALLGRIASRFGSGATLINPGEDVQARIETLARTFHREVVTDLQFEFPADVVHTRGPRQIPNVHPGERVVLSGRYKKAGPVKVVVRGKRGGQEFSREFSVTLPDAVEDHRFIRRLWAQKVLEDKVAAVGSRQDSDAQTEVRDIVAMSRTYSVMTPYTSLLVLENEQAYKQWNIDRTKKEQDQVLGRKGEKIQEESKKLTDAERKEILVMIGQRLELALTAFDRHQYDQASRLLSEILAIDPHYKVARELVEDIQGVRNNTLNRETLQKKILALKDMMAESSERVIPYSEFFQYPDRKAWNEFKKRAEYVLQVEGARTQDMDIQLGPVSRITAGGGTLGRLDNGLDVNANGAPIYSNSTDTVIYFLPTQSNSSGLFDLRAQTYQANGFFLPPLGNNIPPAPRATADFFAMTVSGEVDVDYAYRNSAFDKAREPIWTIGGGIQFNELRVEGIEIYNQLKLEMDILNNDITSKDKELVFARRLTENRRGLLEGEKYYRAGDHEKALWELKQAELRLINFPYEMETQNLLPRVRSLIREIETKIGKESKPGISINLVNYDAKTGLVTLSGGANAGLWAGHVLQIQRADPAPGGAGQGGTLVGYVLVTQVQRESAVGTILESVTRGVPQAGDSLMPVLDAARVWGALSEKERGLIEVTARNESLRVFLINAARK